MGSSHDAASGASALEAGMAVGTGVSSTVAEGANEDGVPVGSATVCSRVGPANMPVSAFLTQRCTSPQKFSNLPSVGVLNLGSAECVHDRSWLSTP